MLPIIEEVALDPELPRYHLFPTIHSGDPTPVTDFAAFYHNHIHTHDNGVGYFGGIYQHTHPHWDGHEHSTANPFIQVSTFGIDSTFLWVEQYTLQHDDPFNFFSKDNPSRVSLHNHGTSTEHFHPFSNDEWININGAEHGHVYRA